MQAAYAMCELFLGSGVLIVAQLRLHLSGIGLVLLLVIYAMVSRLAH